jgi:hypothetical protein
MNTDNPTPGSEALDDALDALESEREVTSFERRRMLKLGSLGVLGVALGGAGSYYYFTQVPGLYFDGRFAYATPQHPPVVHEIVRYANELQDKPYRLGGGHQALHDEGYDCSGSVSHILYRARLLGGPMTSRGFAKYGQPGAGHYVTVFVKPDHHVFMSVCGLRFDTSGGRVGEGPRWHAQPRDPSEFVVRHPPGV